MYQSKSNIIPSELILDAWPDQKTCKNSRYRIIRDLSIRKWSKKSLGMLNGGLGTDTEERDLICLLRYLTSLIYI